MCVGGGVRACGYNPHTGTPAVGGEGYKAATDARLCEAPLPDPCGRVPHPGQGAGPPPGGWGGFWLPVDVSHGGGPRLGATVWTPCERLVPVWARGPADPGIRGWDMGGGGLRGTLPPPLMGLAGPQPPHCLLLAQGVVTQACGMWHTEPGFRAPLNISAPPAEGGGRGGPTPPNHPTPPLTLPPPI